jgi:hypothetical protein
MELYWALLGFVGLIGCLIVIGWIVSAFVAIWTIARYPREFAKQWRWFRGVQERGIFDAFGCAVHFARDARSSKRNDS